MTDEQYYWEKAEFQDPVAHREHVENYKKGIRSSIAFDDRYLEEASRETRLCLGKYYDDDNDVCEEAAFTDDCPYAEVCHKLWLTGR